MPTRLSPAELADRYRDFTDADLIEALITASRGYESAPEFSDGYFAYSARIEAVKIELTTRLNQGATA